MLLLGPNLQYTGPAYWNFLDHVLAFTHRTGAEALATVGPTRTRCIHGQFQSLGTLLEGKVAKPGNRIDAAAREVDEPSVVPSTEFQAVHGAQQVVVHQK